MGTDAGDHRQAEDVSDTGVVARSIVVAVQGRRGGVGHAGILDGNGTRLGGFWMGGLSFACLDSKYGKRGADVGIGGGVGELDLTDSTRENEASFSFLILFVSAHGLEEGFGIETWCRGREAESLQKGSNLAGKAGSEPAEALGEFRLRDHSHGHSLAVLEGAAVARDGLDCVGDGVPVVENGSDACFFSFVSADDFRLQFAASSDDVANGVGVF